MNYNLKNPAALFSNRQFWPKSTINLPTRLKVLSLINIIRSPVKWLKRRYWISSEIRRLEHLDVKKIQTNGTIDISGYLADKTKPIIEQWSSRCANTQSREKAPFPTEEILSDASIRSLALDPKIIGTISRYLGEVPILSSAAIWIGRKNELHAGSPFYHLDSGGWGNVLLYVYLNNVSEETGPFTYIPLSPSLDFVKQTGYLGNALSDDQVSQFYGEDPGVSITGPAGTSFLVDTTRCLHFGSRCTDADRWALIIGYSRASVPNYEPNDELLSLLQKYTGPDDLVERLMSNCKK